MTLIRSYNHKHKMNKGKEEHLLLIYAEYKRVAEIILHKQITSFYKTGDITCEKGFYTPIITTLSERYKDVIKRQVDGMMKSFISNLQNKFKQCISKSSITDAKLRKELFTINKSKKWFEPQNLLARKIIKYCLKGNAFPSVKGINMVINTKIYRTEESKTKTFKYWIKLCTEERAKFIYIPLEENTYMSLQKGELTNSIQVNFKNNELKNITLSIDKEKDVYYIGKSEIGVDIGLNTMLTTSEGDMYGQGFKAKLEKLDSAVQKMESGMRRRNIPFKTNEKYNRLIKRRRDFIKNNVNRNVNTLVNTHKPKEIIVENLDFKGTNIGSKMNRLVSNMGIGVLTNKLDSVSQEKGIKITYVNAAYTSQECSRCHYVDERNRDGEQFKCKHCAYKAHADVNSTKNIKRRSLDTRITIYTKKETIKKLLMSDFVKSSQFSKHGKSSLPTFKSNNHFDVKTLKKIENVFQQK